LRPNSVYDVYFPLRLHQNTYVRQARGAIHLRFRVEWNDERKALLSYLKLPKKTEVLGNAVTVNCSDYKAFRNVVLTVQGKDVPGRYKMSVHRALQREMKLYKVLIQVSSCRFYFMRFSLFRSLILGPLHRRRLLKSSSWIQYITHTRLSAFVFSLRGCTLCTRTLWHMFLCTLWPEL
jgi:hypothetical protein